MQEPDPDPLQFIADLRAWRILARFRWLVIGPSLRIPAETCCESQLVIS
jgi:hypothetical protein